MDEGAGSMKEHSKNLDDHDNAEDEHEHESDRFHSDVVPARPGNVEDVHVELESKDDADEDRVEQEERDGYLCSKFEQLTSDLLLGYLIFEQRKQVHIDQILQDQEVTNIDEH